MGSKAGLARRCAMVMLVSAGMVVGAGVMAVPQQARAVRLLRVPGGGIQPMAEIDKAGTIHLIYFAGHASAGNLFYASKRSNVDSFSTPVRVNSQPDSAIAAGTVRGAQMALGRNGRIHVAWMGSARAQPRGGEDASPMLYTRSVAAGGGFEPQRNVIQQAYGLDGGGTIAADTLGAVHVLWHAGPMNAGEEQRRIWLARSSDDGATFAREVVVNEAGSGLCGCCGLKAMVSADGGLRILFRGFSMPDHRNMYLLASRGTRAPFTKQLLGEWRIAACPLSTSSAMSTADGDVIAWETAGQVAWAFVNPAGVMSPAAGAPGGAGTRKHPGVAMIGDDVLLAWTEGMSWARGGTLHWQGFDRQGRATTLKGMAPGVPAWSRPAVLAGGAGYTIIY